MPLDRSTDSVFVKEILAPARAALAALGHPVGDLVAPGVPARAPWVRRDGPPPNVAAATMTCPLCDRTFTVSWNQRSVPTMTGFTVCEDGNV